MCEFCAEFEWCCLIGYRVCRYIEINCFVVAVLEYDKKLGGEIKKKIRDV